MWQTGYWVKARMTTYILCSSCLFPSYVHLAWTVICSLVEGSVQVSHQMTALPHITELQMNILKWTQNSTTSILIDFFSLIKMEACQRWQAYGRLHIWPVLYVDVSDKMAKVVKHQIQYIKILAQIPMQTSWYNKIINGFSHLFLPRSFLKRES